MRQIINIIFGFFLGLTPILGAAVLGVGIYGSTPNTVGIVIFGLIIVLSAWLGLVIFKKVRIVGPIEFITTIHATPGLDNLEPEPDSSTKRRQPEEVATLINKKENLFKAGTLRIFDDWFGKPYDNVHVIQNANYDKEKEVLTLIFNEDEQIDIYKPIDIFESLTFLKIVHADRIKLSWYYYGKPKATKNLYYLDYKRESNKIHTDSNVDWYKPVFDVSLGASALMIFG